MGEAESYCPPGLRVIVDDLVYEYDEDEARPGFPHVFVYYLTIDNGSDRQVHLLARKWVITRADGGQEVIEGDKIVGKTPILDPGEKFSYNSFHLTDQDCEAEGAFFGLDDGRNRVHVRIPKLLMRVPDYNDI